MLLVCLRIPDQVRDTCNGILSTTFSMQNKPSAPKNRRLYVKLYSNRYFSDNLSVSEGLNYSSDVSAGFSAEGIAVGNSGAAGASASIFYV